MNCQLENQEAVDCPRGRMQVLVVVYGGAGLADGTKEALLSY